MNAAIAVMTFATSQVTSIVIWIFCIFILLYAEAQGAPGELSTWEYIYRAPVLALSPRCGHSGSRRTSRCKEYPFTRVAFLACHDTSCKWVDAVFAL